MWSVLRWTTGWGDSSRARHLILSRCRIPMNRRRIRLALLVLAPVCAVTLVLLYFFLQSRKPKPLEHWVSELRIGVKVLREPGGKFLVTLGNLSDQELATLRISSNVTTARSADG